MRLHRDVSVEVVQSAVSLLATCPAALVHALNLFIPSTGSLPLLFPGDGNKRIDLIIRELASKFPPEVCEFGGGVIWVGNMLLMIDIFTTVLSVPVSRTWAIDLQKCPSSVALEPEASRHALILCFALRLIATHDTHSKRNSEDSALTVSPHRCAPPPNGYPAQQGKEGIITTSSVHTCELRGGADAGD